MSPAPAAAGAAQALLDLAREELALLGADRWEELAHLADRRAALLAALPAVLSAADQALLRSALETQRAAADALARARDDAAGALAGTDRVRAGAAAYAAAAQTSSRA
ncbi:MAG TPA: hypothetical protein VD931_04445 [Baekduia sp.]|nr:hypothetical protein [Baekduia sp.]